MDTVTGRALVSDDVEAVRFTGEKIYADALTQATPRIDSHARLDGSKVRRMLMSRSLLLSEGMAPAPYAAARRCAAMLGVVTPVEIYQAAGAENAAMHLCREPVLLEIQGRLLSLLDEQTLQAVMGHELGHYLAHGEDNPYGDAAYIARRLLASENAQDDWLNLARRLSMAMELTADRFGLLACRDLDSALRLEMVVVTGLSAGELGWDTKAYLEQSRALIESLLEDGETSLGYSHPEHSLRAYALYLFSETDAYRQLTGLGPASRTLADVDALLLKVLGHSEIDLGNAAAFEEPQIEVQECALAACVLVAAADGEIHETEVEAIERVFAHLLPEWRDLLDPDQALERFQELAPILYATGPRAQRALFTLLTHVIAADGECRPEEIDQLLAIGEALGCPALFRSLMPAIIAASTLAIDIADEPPVRSIPMPAEARQVETALRTFFERVARRGGDSVSARRLLRLNGSAKNSSDVRNGLHAAALRAGLKINPELGEELDALHRLELDTTAPRPDAGAERAGLPEDPGSAVARLRKAIARLRDKLVSGDGRSPSIRLRASRAGRSFDLYQLEDVSTGMAERALELLSSAKSLVVISGPEADAHEGSRRVTGALVALDRERQSRTEETGADELYLGYPFLTGLVAGYLLRGPLILYSAAIRRDRGRIAVVAVSDEQPIANQALLRLLFRQKQKAFSETVAEEADAAAAEGPTAMLGFLEQHGIKLVSLLGQLRGFRDRSDELNAWRDDRLEIEDCAVLGLFPQSSSDLLHDYDELLSQLQAGVSPSAILACAGEVLPAELKALANIADPGLASVPAAAPLPAVYADPVQREVLLKARSSRALVIDGPPGTGKSQVIVNLVADALMRGEKLAVICEKRAALDVVVNRLEGLGMRHLLALVHDVQEDRRALYQQVAARIEDTVQRQRPDSTLEYCNAEVARQQADLLRYSQHLATAQAGVTLGTAYTLASGIEAPAAIVAPDLHALDLSAMARFTDALQRLSPFADLWQPSSLWLAPAGIAQRASFASFGDQQTQGLLDQLRRLLEARTAFESCCAAVHLRAHTQALSGVSAAAPGLQAVVSSRSERADLKSAAIFADAFELALRKPEALQSLSSAAAAVQTMEHACAVVSLPPGEESRTRLEAARIPFGTLIELLEGVSTQRQRSLLSSWFSPADDQPQRSSSLERLHGQWRSASADLQGFDRRVTWADTPEFGAAIARLKQQANPLMRLLSPASWKAARQVREHLRSQWSEQSQAKLDTSLFTSVDRRRLAAAAWTQFDDWLAMIGYAESIDDVAAANELLRAAVESRDQASLIRDSLAPLTSLGLWPPPAVALAWAGWRQRIQSCLAVLPAMEQAQRQVAELRANMPRSEIKASLAALQRIADIAQPVTAIMPLRAALEAIGVWPAGSGLDDISAWDGAVDRHLRLLDSETGLRQTLSPVLATLPWLQADTSLPQLRDLLDSATREMPRLIESDQLLAKASLYYAQAAEQLRSLAAMSALQPAHWTDALCKAWAIGVASSIEAKAAGLSPPGLLQDEEDAAAGRFRAFSTASSETISRLVLALQDENPWLRTPVAAKGARRNDAQTAKEGMLREARKQRNVMPLRSFVRRFVGDGLLEALPVWLLSPETMAQLFPREPVFDLVILDEASQCTVESGLPVLMRAKRVVIAGDERQMPPSNFFKAAVSDEEAVEEDSAPRDILDAESLLVLARSRTAHTGLAWHYRCQHEELIAFSNHAIYSGTLRTIPSTHSRTAPAAVYWRHVPNAVYEDGLNLAEAEAVVDLLAELIGGGDPPTVGVITFNLRQRRAVLDAIDQRRAADAGFAALYDREATRDRIDERPFVKNLENVQGDERDVIVFSLGHAPRDRIRKDGRKEQYVPARFGPVGQRGGERRLNVAVSRAKQAIHIVASFEPAMLSVANSRNQGPRLFKGFLEFSQAMAGGRRNEGERVLDLMRGKPLQTTAAGLQQTPHPSYVPLKTQLLLALEREGYKCELDVGASNFKVPLAVIDPMRESRYRLGILCAEGVAVDLPIEAHVHVPAVLEQRGWRLLRVNARDWALQPRMVMDRVRASLSA